MNLDVVGGTYRERCKEGEWNQIYGSGLRAAAALQNAATVRFHTFVGVEEQSLLDTVASTFDVEVDASVADRTVEFLYDHALSVPLIFPPVHTLATRAPINVAGENILRFGMVEGDAVVDGKLVVYDPQSAYTPELFHSNGSKAERLVIVCNRREATLLSGEPDLSAAASKLLTDDVAEAVIVKCGSHGAFLVSTAGQQYIPAFRTDRVWPLGSGDVFAASFFAHWAHGASHEDAALGASKATAYYCDTRALPIPTFGTDVSDHEPLSLRTLAADETRPRIYLAGPFFNMGQRWMVNEAREALMDQGLDVFSPYHDVGFGVASEVVPADIEALHRADVILALLDELDSGTLFEVGYARCLGKPVIGFCQNTPEEPLKMLVGTDCYVVDDFVSAIYHTAWTALQT